MKKKHLGKKTLSVFLAVMMLMTCWVFVAPEKAEALLGTYYGKPEVNGVHFNNGTTNAYGTPVFNGNLDRWFKWQNGDDWTTVYYPSHIYLDKSESLQAAGYYFNVNWHFGDGASYRILLGANVWGDNTAWNSYGDGRIRTMNNIFSNYAVDASCTDGYYTLGDGGLYYNGGSNYDLRIIGYGYDSQGTDGFNQNGIRHDKYVLFRSRQSTNNATIYLKGNPSESYVGKTTEYNTSGGSFGSYGLAQQYGNNNTWKTHSNGSAQFNSKGSDSSYKEGQWIEMAWNVTIYDKSDLNSLINTATTMSTAPQYSFKYKKALQSAIATARAVLTKRATNQTEIDNAKAALQTVVSAPVTRSYDVTFENLFSINDWYNSESSSYNSSNGEVTVESNSTTIKIYKSVTAELTTGCSYPGNHSEDKYSIPVTGGEEYTVRFNTTSSVSGGTIVPEVFLFWYDINNYPVNNTDGTATFNNKAFSGNGDHSVTFTAPDGATKAEIRFDNDCSSSASTLRFNNIAVYPAERATEIELDTWTNRPYTKAYTYNTALGSTLSVPARPGYAFNGWYLDNNNDDVMASDEIVTNGNGEVLSNLQSFGITTHYNLKADWVPAEYTLTFDGNGGTPTQDSLAYDLTDTITFPNATRDSYAFDGWKVTTAGGNWVAGDIYKVNERVTGKYGNTTFAAQWTNLWTVTFLNGDGSVLGTASVRNGEAAAAPQATPTKAADANYSYDFSSWDIDFSNVTADMTVTPQFTSVPHTITYDFVSGRTCTTNAIVDKRCSGCNYYFFQGQPYDGTTETAWIALGHDFEGQAAVTGSSNGEAGTHEVRCKYYYTESCGGTTRAAHSFDNIISTEGADCVTAGTVTKKCACGQETKVSGDTAPDVHNNTRLVGVKAATCLEDGYTGDTYCDNCKKTVKVGAVNPKLGHSFTNYVYNNDATCFADGTKTAKCDRCDVTDEKTAEGTQLSHEYTNYVYNNDATCDNNGTKTATCDNGCGTESTIEAEGTKRTHIFEGTIKNNEDGTHSYECTYDDCDAYGGTADCSSWKENKTDGKCECEDCGYTKAHTWSAWAPSSDNSDSAKGKMSRSCSVCKATDTSDCTYEQSAHFDATCTSPERTTYTCTECDHGYTVIGEAAKGHNFSGEYKYNANTDSHQQLCANGCGTYGVGTTANAMEPCSWSYANKETGKHTASCVCGNTEEQNCSGGTATCTAQAKCQHCDTAYGDKAVHSFKGAVKVLDGDVHAYLCEFCGTTTGIYGIGNTENDTEDCSGGDATCSALAVCEKCNDTYGKLDADDHKWITPPVADADNAGKHIYTCEYNNEHKKSEDCVSGSSVVVAPKCEEQGYTIQTCKDCSYEWNTDYTDATDHNWVDPVCNDDGTHTLTCNNENADGWACDETLTLNCAESAITFGLETATCTEQGYTTYQCTVCNYTWDADFVPATGHSYTKKLRSLDATYKRSEKTCTEAETYWYRCDNCTVSAGTEEDKYADDLASIYWTNGSAAGHKMEKLVDANDLTKNRVSEATCTAAAVYYYSCSVCGEQDTNNTFSYGASLGHDYQNLVDETDLTKNRVSEATCTAAAIYNKSCSRCGNVSKETFEYGTKIGHSMTKTDAVAATCSTAGNVEYYTCSNCNKTFSDEEGSTVITKTEIAALGHAWVTVPYKAATCDEDGHSEYKDCSRCDEIKGKSIYTASGHNFSGGYYCDTTNNYHAKYCVNDDCTDYGIDGVKYSVEYDGLDYVIRGGEQCEFTSSETDTDENGIHSHKLTCVCGNATSKAYTDEETFVETVASTCTADGYDSHKCPDCDATWQKNIVKTTGHDWAEKATSNGNGTHSVECSKCDATTDTAKCSGGKATCKDKAVCEVCGGTYGETTGHTLTEDGWTSNGDATCTADGTKKQNCSVCDTEVTVTDEGSKLGHAMIADYTYDISGWTAKPEDFDKDIKAPTCGDEGLSIIYCTRCDYYKTKVVPANSGAHVWETDDAGEIIWKEISGNCATGVTFEATCSICGKTQTKVETTDHDWKTVISIPAKCTKYGSDYQECSVCGFERTLTYDENNPEETAKYLPTGEHDYVEKETVAATCTKEGYTVYVCSVCNGEKIETAEGIFAEHNMVTVNARKVSCEANGYSEHLKCTVCDTTEGLTIYDAIGHSDNGEGKCSECNAKLYDTDEGEKGCGCICHKDSWLMRIIYKIINFFWKLFKISKSCDCGAVHW